MKFEPFYHAMVTDAKNLILPNTNKKTEELDALMQYCFDGLHFNPNEIVHEKTANFKYPIEIRDAAERKIFHDNLKKDVMIIKAAILQSYLIREEQNQIGDEETILYRLQAKDASNILDLYSKTRGTTFCNKRSRITQAMNFRLYIRIFSLHKWSYSFLANLNSHI